jgi:hypothetical protein
MPVGTTNAGWHNKCRLAQHMQKDSPDGGSATDRPDSSTTLVHDDGDGATPATLQVRQGI